MEWRVDPSGRNRAGGRAGNADAVVSESPPGANGLHPVERHSLAALLTPDLRLRWVPGCWKKSTSAPHATPRPGTLLGDRHGILSVHGEEGAGYVALRMDLLADVLPRHDYLDV